jgi:uncharacterized protein YgbK (DUF1537 family)
MTERQISVALQNGFAGVEANPVALLTDPQHQQAIMAEATQHLEQNRSVIIYTARGEASNQSKPLEAIADARRKISLALGTILRTLIEKHELTRAVIAGGDTSSHALAALKIHALTTRFPLKETPGAPLCTAYSSNPRLNGLEIAMKGGQLGGDEFFIRMRDGI